MRLKHSWFLLWQPFLVARFGRNRRRAGQSPCDARGAALLAYIDSISGKATMTGQHNYPNDVSRWSDRGVRPDGQVSRPLRRGLWLFRRRRQGFGVARPAMIAEAIRQYRSGAVIALTWHEVRPTDDEPVTFRDSVQGHLTDFEWKRTADAGHRSQPALGRAGGRGRRLSAAVAGEPTSRCSSVPITR